MSIKTYTTKEFRAAYMADDHEENLYKPGFERFFCVTLEDTRHRMKLPVPPSKETGHAIVVVTSGDYKVTIGFETCSAFYGQLMVVPAGKVFSITHLNTSVKGYVVLFHPEFLIGSYADQPAAVAFDFFNIWSTPTIAMGYRKFEYVVQLARRMQDEYQEQGIANTELLRAYLVALLTEVDSLHQKRSVMKNNGPARLVTEFRKLLFRHFKKVHHVGFYAEALGVSPGHLNKVTRAVEGKSPSQLITDLLLPEAKSMLYQTRLSISEIAAEIGFSDPSHFARVFKKHTGQSPRQYRNRK